VRTTVYMSHPLAGDFQLNIHNGGLWYRFIRGLSAKGVQKLLVDRPDKVVRQYQKVVTNTGLTEPRAVLSRPFDEPPVIIAPWLTCAVPDIRYPGGRPRAIDDGIHMVRVVDENWQVGEYVSPGMRDEANHAKMVRDLTFWGVTPPLWEDTELFE
jgi:hypothetical protein